jgi:hypothetical protein
MKTRVTIIALLAMLLSPLCGLALGADATELQKTATDLFASLTSEQRKEAALPFDSPERTSEVFPGGKRAGIQIRKLDDKQQKLAIALLTAFTSDYGKQKAEAISRQDSNDPGLGRYFLCFFGEPGKDAAYAWRIAEHHLTLIDVEVEEGKPARFGPILLGANPPVLWDEEEDALIALYGAMSDAERAKASRKGSGISTRPIGDAGVKVSELGPTAQEQVKAVYENRLKFFAPAIAERVRSIVDGAGGIQSMQVAFFGEANQRCRDGGKWDFKLGGPTFLADYENTRGHIHMSMKGELKK